MWVILFLCATILGLAFISVAVVILLGEALGTLSGAILVVGMAWIVVAVVVYALKLHAIVDSIKQRLTTIYDVSAMFEMAYRKILLFIKNIVGGV